ncbi:hypothetical protein AYI69_g4373 [Smittium culicis]|uniref:Uncharacterized protein n=1 Tax=Smittium culicis TaxID=133412 RepID=A0A1R1YE64_9FUNG|nr:hypothetical protein AYI69_g4373 [Smittium culicis]
MTITQAIRSCSPSCFYNLDRIEKSRLGKRFVDFGKKISNGDTECIQAPFKLINWQVLEIDHPLTGSFRIFAVSA